MPAASANGARAIGARWAVALWRARSARAIGGQAAISGFHFLLNLALIRLLSPADYGLFALAFVMAMYAAALNNALIATPLSVYTPVLRERTDRRRQEAAYNGLNLVFFAAVLLAGLLLGALGRGAALSTALATALFVAAYANRQYTRSFGYARLRAEVPAGADLLYVLSAALGCALAAQVSGGATAAILLALAAANLLASAVELHCLGGATALPRARTDYTDYRRHWPQTRWALIGALTTLTMAQAHSLIVSASHGASAFAPLAAGATLFGPVRVALTTWQNLAKPRIAIAFDRRQDRRVVAQLQWVSAALLAALAALALGLWLAWPVIDRLLFAAKYAGTPMAQILAFWLAITVFVALNAPIAAALQALADFKALAMGSVYGATISTLLAFALLAVGGPLLSLGGVLVAECFLLLYLIARLRQRLRQRGAC